MAVDPQHQKFIKVTVDTPATSIAKDTQYKANCGTIIFRNEGSVTVKIDNLYTIKPLENFTIECYPGELNIHTYSITFVGGYNQSGCNLIIITKVYKQAQNE